VNIQQLILSIVKFALELADYDVLLDDTFDSFEDQITFVVTSAELELNFRGLYMWGWLDENDWTEIEKLFTAEIKEREDGENYIREVNADYRKAVYGEY
jgi:hypothetical protein